MYPRDPDFVWRVRRIVDGEVDDSFDFLGLDGSKNLHTTVENWSRLTRAEHARGIRDVEVKVEKVWTHIRALAHFYVSRYSSDVKPEWCMDVSLRATTVEGLVVDARKKFEREVNENRHWFGGYVLVNGEDADYWHPNPRTPPGRVVVLGCKGKGEPVEEVAGPYQH